jgi:hypothetical protein
MIINEVFNKELVVIIVNILKTNLDSGFSSPITFVDILDSITNIQGNGVTEMQTILKEVLIDDKSN